MRRACLSASTLPSKPPAGSAPRTSEESDGDWLSDSSAESDVSSITKPRIFATGASSIWLRNHRIATTNIPTGKRNAENPQNWKNRSAMCAPTGPIQLRTGPTAGADTLKEGSCGE